MQDRKRDDYRNQRTWVERVEQDVLQAAVVDGMLVKGQKTKIVVMVVLECRYQAGKPKCWLAGWCDKHTLGAKEPLDPDCAEFWRERQASADCRSDCELQLSRSLSQTGMP